MKQYSLVQGYWALGVVGMNIKAYDGAHRTPLFPEVQLQVAIGPEIRPDVLRLMERKGKRSGVFVFKRRIWGLG